MKSIRTLGSTMFRERYLIFNGWSRAGRCCWLLLQNLSYAVSSRFPSRSHRRSQLIRVRWHCFSSTNTIDSEPSLLKRADAKSIAAGIEQVNRRLPDEVSRRSRALLLDHREMTIIQILRAVSTVISLYSPLAITRKGRSRMGLSALRCQLK